MGGKAKAPTLGELLIVVTILGLLSALGGAATPLEALVALATGWWEWPPRLARVVLHHPVIAMTLMGAVVALGLGLHYFFRWLWRQRPGAAPWRPRMSAVLVGIALLWGATAIALFGLVHEVSWLATLEHLSVNGDRKKVLRRRAEQGLAVAESHARAAQRHYLREGQFPKPYRRPLAGEGSASQVVLDKQGGVTVFFAPRFFVAPFASPGERALQALQWAGSLELQPRTDGAGAMVWRCSAEFAAGFGPLNFIPQRCAR